MRKKIKAVFEALSRMPYKWAWIAMFVTSAVLFGWWDEVLVWGLGATYAWWVVPVYYILEYGVMLPLTLVLGLKTYKKLGLKVSLKGMAVNSLKNSLPAMAYRKIKGRFKDDKKE